MAKFTSEQNACGTGLGLFVANQIVEQHGGAIAVASEPGKGSQFKIKLLKTLPDSIRRRQPSQALFRSEN